MNNWQQIFTNVSLLAVTTVYVAIGCAMESYTELTPSNNQQYPCFLEKFHGRHIVVLIDPVLEFLLKIQIYFALKKKPLTQMPCDVDNCRIFENHEVTVFAFNTSFYYEHRHFDPNVNPTQLAKINEQCDQDITNIINLISICLGKIQKTRVILQDYSGGDTCKLFAQMMTLFDHDDLLKWVLFDVTQKECGCYIDITPELAEIDSFGHFIQIKYMKLTDGTDSPIFREVIKRRLDSLGYPICWIFINLSKDPTFDYCAFDKNKIDFMFALYRVDIDHTVKSISYILAKYNQLIQTVLADVIIARGFDMSIHDIIMRDLSDRNAFFKHMELLKKF
jgi:hypothetical protein